MLFNFSFENQARNSTVSTWKQVCRPGLLMSRPGLLVSRPDSYESQPVRHKMAQNTWNNSVLPKNHPRLPRTALNYSGSM